MRRQVPYPGRHHLCRCRRLRGQAMKERHVKQTTGSAKQMQKKRKKVMERIATWFSEAGIPSNTVCLESFDLMLEAIGQFGPGLQGPSTDELDGPLLQRQVLAINDSVEALKKSCALEGCSLFLLIEGLVIIILSC